MFRDALDWFEIPVAPIEAAQRFYEALLDIVAAPAPAAQAPDERPCPPESARAPS
jgi:predicted enzyme related to lactoylglutathione lyase